jgi:hypothetical protein
MNPEPSKSQYRKCIKRNIQQGRDLGPESRERVIPNPKGKLLDQVREVMRLRHYSLRTERS